MRPHLVKQNVTGSEDILWCMKRDSTTLDGNIDLQHRL